MGFDGGETVTLKWQGAAISGALLFPLWRRAEWARHLLMVCALALVIVIGSEGVPPIGPSFGLLAVLAVLQLGLLIGMGKENTLAARSARRPSEAAG